MANYYGVTRTNYVRLKDELAYEQFAQVVGLMSGDTNERLEDGARFIAAFGNDDDGEFCTSIDLDELVESGYQSRHADSELDAKRSDYQPDENGISEVQFLDNQEDLLHEVYPLLADGEVFVLQSAGSERQRYVSGYSEAISWTGERVSVHIDDIYELARKTFNLAEQPSSATY